MQGAVEKAIEEARRSFAENLRKARQAAGLTQSELAGLLGVQVHHISDLERARRSPSFKLLVSAATRLSVTPQAMLEPAELRRTNRGRPSRAASSGDESADEGE